MLQHFHLTTCGHVLRTPEFNVFLMMLPWIWGKRIAAECMSFKEASTSITRWKKGITKTFINGT